ncbi:MAG: DNA mismatch repair endonuclease MutL [Oscillibacter sp.]|nr:DNA mismatch repair endonuclease MutL [Oscillibacter sp.]
MAFIQQLAPHVADLIAAGEVVERPASVVKELVENAIDAGATAIVVEIRRGGMGLIRVTDNGCGIAPAELPTAFLRHATSKLRRAEDLAGIGTLGFRGEALAAIAAVSRVEILTRQKGAASGAALRLEGGVPGEVEDAGAPEGTTISVQDLFFNTPARLKFMRKDSAETAAVAGLMQHLALSHPDISFRFRKDGVDSLHTPGDGRLESAIYAALGRDFARGLVEVRGKGGDISVHGFVTQPLMGRGSRGMQTFFVNGRFIKSQLLTAALEEGYRNQIMKGKFPGCVLFVTLPVTAVDVNVHPAKTQVKFAREKEVFDAVYHTVLDGLEQKNTPAGEKKAAETVNPRNDFFQTMDAKTFRQSAHAAPPVKKEERGAAQPTYPSRSRPNFGHEGQTVMRLSDVETKPAYQVDRKPAPVSALGKAPASVIPSAPAAREEKAPWKPVVASSTSVKKKEEAPKTVPAEEKKSFTPAIPQEKLELPGQESFLKREELPWRMVGEVLRTYIICESAEGEIWLIDKHAAHERINFDRLMAADTPPMRQTLLRPIAAALTKEDGALLLENLPLMESLGFACEDFGDSTVLVREVPADMDAEDTTATLEEFAQNLRSGRTLEERRENLYHTMACKAAIKGGWRSDEAELKVLVEKVRKGEVKYCPHGRPVAVKLTKYELEKMFKRA